MKPSKFIIWVAKIFRKVGWVVVPKAVHDDEVATVQLSIRARAIQQGKEIGLYEALRRVKSLCSKPKFEEIVAIYDYEDMVKKYEPEFRKLDKLSD